MSDFNNDLLGKCYQLANDQLDLADFKLWFAAQMASGVARDPSKEPAPNPKPSQGFQDYSAAIENLSDDWTDHQNRMLGSGDME